MKRIPPALARQVEDLSAETPLPAYAIEKDFFIVEVLRILSTTPTDAPFGLVFCGGTCLAKAYGVLHRMSEDIDFKIFPRAGCTPPRATATLRRELAAYVQSITRRLEDAGFHGISRKASDNNRHTSLDLHFQSAFPKPESLRPHILIELSYAPLMEPPQSRKVGTLFDLLRHGTYPDDASEIECVSLREALAEKLISFPRRLALHLHRTSPGNDLSEASGWDCALVRHLYDVHQILASGPAPAILDQQLQDILLHVMGKDASDFATQHPAFVDAPRREIALALSFARNSTELQDQYKRFIRDMVYAPGPPSFTQCLAVFESALHPFLINPGR